MIDADIHRLAAQEPVPALDHMETDIWAGVGRRAIGRQSLRRIVGRQAAVMVAAVVVSVTTGFLWATSSELAYSSVHLVAGAELAPSHLLFGARR